MDAPLFRLSSEMKYRPDIDGMRAFAILSVLMYHAFPQIFPAGYIGVDIFFVISGYLITYIIFEDITRGKFSYFDFYAKRLRRIVPSLFVVLLASFVVGFIFLTPVDFKNLSTSIVGGAVFVQNIVLYNQVGYFDISADKKPLLHLWSLGIEEQYYIIWPPIIYFLYKLKNVKIFFCILISIFAVSFFLCLFENSDASFYLLPARFWELLAGGGYAIFSHKSLSQRPHFVWQKKAVLSVCGVLLVSLGIVLITIIGNREAYLSIFPVLGSVLLIAAGPNNFVNNYLLGNRWMIRIGLISYPLYLWHWPLLSFARIITGATLPTILVCKLLLLSFVLSYLTWLLIEVPVRKKLFASFAVRKKQISIISLAVFSLFFMTMSAGIVFFNNGFPQRVAHSSWREALDDISNYSVDEQIRNLHLNNRVCETHPAILRACSTLAEANGVRAVMYGDSHAAHWLLGLENNPDARKKWLIVANSACPPAQNLNTAQGTRPINCLSMNQEALNFLVDHKEIKTVVLSSLGVPYINDPNIKSSPYSRDGLLTISSPLYDGGREEIFYETISDTISKLMNNGKKVVYIVDNPEFPIDVNYCVAHLSEQSSDDWQSKCVLSRQKYETRTKNYHAMIDRLHRKFPDMYVYNYETLFCGRNSCQFMEGRHSLIKDQDHLSPYGSRIAADNFLQWLKSNNLSD